MFANVYVFLTTKINACESCVGFHCIVYCPRTVISNSVVYRETIYIQFF